MVGTAKKSPIETLLSKNLSMIEASSEARRSNFNLKSKPCYMLLRTKRFGNKQTTLLNSQDSDNACEQSINENSAEKKSPMVHENDDYARKERLLDRLRYLGLAPRKYGNSNLLPSLNKRKRQTPRKAHPDNDNFLEPRVFECDYCPMLFFNKNLYRRHTIKHLRIRRCNGCSKPFNCTVSLRRHQSHCQKRVY